MKIIVFPLPPPPPPSHAVMRHEVSCVDITPVGERRDKADLCTVGLWTEIAVQVLFLPSLEVVYTQMLGGGMWDNNITLIFLDTCTVCINKGLVPRTTPQSYCVMLGG